MTFPNGLPGTWNILATGVTVQVTPDPAAAPGDYDITYRVTDPIGRVADAILKVTIVGAGTRTSHRSRTRSAFRLRSRQPSVATLVYSDPEGETLVPVLDTADIPAGWTADGERRTRSPSRHRRRPPGPQSSGTR